MLDPTSTLTTLLIKDRTGAACFNNSIIAELFSEEFSKIYTEEPATVLPDLLQHTRVTVSIEDVEFSTQTVFIKMSRLKASGMPGPDSISSLILKNCAQSLCETLYDLMRESVDIKQLPSIGLTAHVTLIF